MSAFLFRNKLITCASILTLVACNGQQQLDRDGSGVAPSSSSASSSGIASSGYVYGVGVAANVEAISSSFSYYSHAYSSETVHVIGAACPTSTGIWVNDSQASFGYFDFDDFSGSRLDFPLASNAGGPVGNVSAEIHFSNGYNNPLPMEVWINDQKVLDDLHFPSTGGWLRWQAMHIDLGNSMYNSTVQLSLVAKSPPGGPNIEVTRIEFIFNCTGATGCGNLNLPIRTCP
jgi:hypothetical protein